MVPMSWEMPNDPFKNVSQIMKECWRQKIESRVSMLHVKKSLHKILYPKSEVDTGSPQKYAGILSNGSTIPMSQRLNHQ